jgi:hypothetical protein
MNPVRTWEPSRIADIFEWLDHVRERPSMYLNPDDGPLRELEAMIYGYETATAAHRVEEYRPRFGLPFLAWVRIRNGWSMSSGWANAVSKAARSGQRPLDLFFELVDQYRKVSPRVIARARLTKRNRATGKVWTDGLGRAQAPPRVMEIVQYDPEQLFLLRYRYAHVSTLHVLHDKGREETSVEFAKQVAEREFDIVNAQWRHVTSRRSQKRGGSRRSSRK